MIDLNGARNYEQRTVLVVDDTRLIRHFISRYVERVGFTALQAENGKDAWQLILKNIPDLVITDIEMPILDGLQLIRQIRSSTDLRVQPIPIFVCSSVTSQLLEGSSLLRVEQVMRKPLNLRTLHQGLMRMTGGGN